MVLQLGGLLSDIDMSKDYPGQLKTSIGQVFFVILSDWPSSFTGIELCPINHILQSGMYVIIVVCNWSKKIKKLFRWHSRNTVCVCVCVCVYSVIEQALFSLAGDVTQLHM